MQGDRNRTGRLRRREDLDAVAPGGVHHDLAHLPRPELSQASDQVCQGIVRHGQQHELGAADDLLHLQHRDARQHDLSPLTRGLRDGVDADDLVLHRPQGRTEDRADLAG